MDGQLGSSKSALAAGAVRELRANGGVVVIDADWMCEENPRYRQLSREDPQRAIDRTQGEAGEQATRLALAAVENRHSLAVDGTMRSSENVQDLTIHLRGQGYKAETRVLTIDPKISVTRTQLRFEEQMAGRGIERFVNKEQHDNAYSGMVESVRALGHDKLTSSVHVYDANQQQIYGNNQERREWKR